MRIVRPRTAAMKTSTIVIIVIVVIGVLGLGCIGSCIGFGFWGAGKVKELAAGSEQAAEAFMGQLQANQLQAAYDSASPAFKANQTFERFSAFVKTHPNLTAHTKREQTNTFELQVKGAVKTNRIAYQLNGPAGVTFCSLNMIEINEQWQVDSLTVP